MNGNLSKSFWSVSFFVVLFLSISHCSGPAQSANLLKTINQYQGLHEHSDRKLLRRMIGVDPATTAWCGAMLTFVVKENGMAPPAGSLKAAAWKNWRSYASRSAANIGAAVAVVLAGKHVGVYAGTDKRGRTCVVAGNTGNGVRRACYSGKYWIRK